MFDDPFKNEWTFDEMIENQITEQEQQPSNSISVIEQQNNKQEKQHSTSISIPVCTRKIFVITVLSPPPPSTSLWSRSQSLWSRMFYSPSTFNTKLDPVLYYSTIMPM